MRGEAVKVYDIRRNQIDLFNAPDEIKLEIEDFNRKVITQPFNRVVCEYLARELDPSTLQKTLIFCANDAHADLVVEILKDAFQKRYGSIDDDAVIKITGAADKPLQLIRRFKNERNPNVAVRREHRTSIPLHQERGRAGLAQGARRGLEDPVRLPGESVSMRFDRRGPRHRRTH